MAKSDELQAAAVVTKTPIPPATTSQQDAIDAFLRHYLERIEHSCNDHRVIAMTDRTPRLQGIILYQRHQMATLKTLIAANLSRAKRGTTTGPRGRK